KTKLFIYHEKRENSRVSITKTGIHIRLPLYLSAVEQEHQIAKFIDWVKARLEEKPQVLVPKYRSFKDQENLELYDKTYTLNIRKSSAIEKPIIAAKSDSLHFVLPAELQQEEEAAVVSKLLAKKLGKLYKLKIWEKLRKFNTLHQFGELKSLSMKNNSSNWGSCSSKGNINISVRLLLAPEKVLDYVLIHELAHLKEQNHSAKYWQIVKLACPDYKNHELWLKTNAKNCII
ncbi:MAG: M48 family metallopeptidase, partial [Bacteroidetes bacterium]|nr:M48 family metallopeptidase [Bacteroidota bacterium]